MAEPLTVNLSDLQDAPPPSKSSGGLTVNLSDLQDAPPEKPNWAQRAWKATGLPDTARALFEDFSADNPDPGIVVHNATKLLGNALNQSGEHTTEMMKAGASGDFLGAAGHLVASTPFVGPMIDKLATHIENGELPEAAGTALMLFGPKVLDASKGSIGSAAEAAKPIIDTSGAVAKGAATGLVKSIPQILDSLPVVKAIVPAGRGVASGVQGALSDLRAARAADAARAATEARVPLWQGATEGAAKPVDLGSMAEMTPQEIQAKATEIRAANLAARRVSPSTNVPRGTSEPEPTAPPSQASLGDLTTQLNYYRDQLRAMQPDPPMASEASLADLLQTSLDLAKMRKAQK